jgi:aminomethyltransferase
LIFADETSETPIGAVTSGGFGPTVQGPVAMGYVPTEVAKAQEIVFGEVRGKRLPVEIVSLPFTAANFKR